MSSALYQIQYIVKRTYNVVRPYLYIVRLYFERLDQSCEIA